MKNSSEQKKRKGANFSSELDPSEIGNHQSETSPAKLQRRRIECVVFDLGKVLLDFDYQIAAQKLAPHCTVEASAIQELIDQSHLLSRYETGSLSRGEFFNEVRSLTGFRADLEDFAKLFADIFTPIESMIDLHARLRQRNLPTFIFSNTNDLAIEHIRARYPFFENFSGYIFSYEHRAMKPDHQIYKVVEEMTGNEKEEILYIDDRAENISAAQERNWITIHQTHPDTTLSKFQDLGLI